MIDGFRLIMIGLGSRVLEHESRKGLLRSLLSTTVQVTSDVERRLHCRFHADDMHMHLSPEKAPCPVHQPLKQRYEAEDTNPRQAELPKGPCLR